MITNDKYTVRYYIMTGTRPDPEHDTLVGNDIIWQGQDPDLNHAVTLALPPGIYTVYAVATDRQGNTGLPGNLRRFEVQ